MDKKAALYLRVSTVYQVDKDSLPLQRKDLIAYVEMILGIKDYEVFEDAGFSGKNTDRPAYQEMMERTRKGEFSHILVWKIDRISRNLLDFASMYAELKKLRVAFVSKNERFDTSTPMGEAMLKIILVFAELERNMTSMRVSAVMKDRAKQGQWNGANIPYGYDWDSVKKYPVPNPAEAAIVKQIYACYIKERNLSAVTRMLVSLGAKSKRGGQWDTATIRQMIINPFYKGTLRYNYKDTARGQVKPENEWIIVENNHEPMVDAATWEKCQQILASNTSFKHNIGKTTRHQEQYIFGGLMKCSACGYPMRAHIMPRKSGINPGFYNCSRRWKYAKPCYVKGCMYDEQLLPFLLTYITHLLEARKHPERFADAKALTAFLLDGEEFSNITGIDESEELLSSLRQLYRHQQIASQGTSTGPSVELAALNSEKSRNERALKRLQDIYLYDDESMTPEEYVKSKRELQEAIRNIEQKIIDVSTGTAEAAQDDFILLASSFALLKHITAQAPSFSFLEIYNTVGPAVVREFFHSIIETMVVDDGKLKSITWKNGSTHTFLY